MKRLSTGVLALLISAGLGLNAVAAPSQPASQGNIGNNAIAQATPAASAAPAASPAASAAPAAPAAPAASVPPANFGSPPSGEIPILFNDHHVYTKPDELKQGRVLAALVRGGTILIPLRSMFEQMGATVSYDPATKTADVSKPGADVKVTVGKPEVVINGETRPLDVPPEMYHGHVVVPVRVISEGMGAYVQWVPDRHLVVVRYLPPTPPPPPAPAASPTAPPTPVPTVAPTALPHAFIAGDWIVSPKVYNEFSPGNIGNVKKQGMSYRLRGALEFNLLDLPWMIEGDYRTMRYPHNQTVATDPAGITGPAPGAACTGAGIANPNPATEPGCVNTIGSVGETFVPQFTAQDNSLDARLGLRVLDSQSGLLNGGVYVGAGYLWRSGNYGYPKLSNFGFGVEKLPSLKESGFTWYGSAYYYGDVKGTCGTTVCPAGPFVLAYNIVKYDIGGAIQLGKTVPAFLDFGYLGQSGKNKSNAPDDFVESGPYVGLGLKF